jgi:hypothetical protein
VVGTGSYTTSTTWITNTSRTTHESAVLEVLAKTERLPGWHWCEGTATIVEQQGGNQKNRNKHNNQQPTTNNQPTNNQPKTTNNNNKKKKGTTMIQSVSMYREGGKGIKGTHL